MNEMHERLQSVEQVARVAGTVALASFGRGIAVRARLARSWGDCHGYLLVATGRAEAMLDAAMSVWDSAALLPVIEEAGGVFTDWSGRRTGFGGEAIATNAALAVEVRRVLAVTP